MSVDNDAMRRFQRRDAVVVGFAVLVASAFVARPAVSDDCIHSCPATEWDARGCCPANKSAPRKAVTPTKLPATQVCPAEMVRVPKGTFLMGDGLDQHKVTLSGYCIDRTEVTVAAYAKCVSSAACQPAPLTASQKGWTDDTAKLFSQYCNGNGNDRQNHPVNCVDWSQAKTYCEWAQKRLPTEAEWEYAARGRDGRKYPWGNDAPSSKKLNACGSECAEIWKRVFNDEPKPMYADSDGWESTAPVGSYPAGVSPFGASDVGGNVSEWTSDWYQTNPGMASGTERVIRGGGWVDYSDFFETTSHRVRFRPGDRDGSIGFRCVRGD